MQTTDTPGKSRIFYGYWIVAATFFFCFISSGCGFISFSLFVNPLQADFNWGRGEIIFAFSLYLLASGVFSPFIGRLIYRFDVRKIIAIGALLFGLGFVLQQSVDHDVSNEEYLVLRDTFKTEIFHAALFRAKKKVADRIC